MSRIKTIFTISTLCLISACSLFEPFVDRRREAGVYDPSKLYIGKSTPSNPAICYNTWLTSKEEVQKMADDECKKQKTGTKATEIDETMFTCRVFIPNHKYFQCVKE